MTRSMIAAADPSNAVRVTTLRISLALFAVVLAAGCAGLPADRLGPPSTALPASGYTALGRIAAAAAPDAELSGFRLMPGGANALDTRLQLARRAERSLDVQYYQIENDATGRYFLRELRDAAKRGVRVRLLVDDLYTAGDDELLLAFAAHDNVEMRLFNPFAVGRAQLSTRLLGALLDFDRVNRRMHNKLMIADGVMAVAGGRNIGDRYFRRGSAENFIDLDTFASGPIVGRLAELFDRYWNSNHAFPVAAVAASHQSRAELQARFDELTSPLAAPAPPPPPPNDSLGYGPMRDEFDAGRLGLIWAPAQAFADRPERVIGETASYGGVPLLDVQSVRYNVREQMRRAQSEVAIAAPYLIPGAAGMEVLAALRRRDVSMSIVTSSLAATDEPLVHTGYRRYRLDMLALGVELYELSSDRARRSVRLGIFGSDIGRMHLKTAVIDREILYVGSMNFDPRSDLHNTELGLIVSSPQLAQQVLKLIALLKQQGSYRLRINAATGTIEWVNQDAHSVEVLHEEPDSSVWQRALLNLLAPLVPESLL